MQNGLFTINCRDRRPLPSPSPIADDVDQVPRRSSSFLMIAYSVFEMPADVTYHLS